MLDNEVLGLEKGEQFCCTKAAENGTPFRINAGLFGPRGLSQLSVVCRGIIWTLWFLLQLPLKGHDLAPKKVCGDFEENASILVEGPYLPDYFVFSTLFLFFLRDLTLFCSVFFLCFAHIV